MNLTSLAYDAPTYVQDLTQSTGPSDYILGTPWRQCAPCMPVDRPSRQGTSTCGNHSMVDVDSELLGLNRRASRNACEMYKPSDFCSDMTPVVDCPPMTRSEDTRFSNPPCTLRSTGFNRWEWLCQNPQNRVELPFQHPINSQLIVKDTHRPVLPTPFDPRAALPPDDEAPIHASAQPMQCYELKANLPLVSWRSCAEIARY